MTFINDIKLMMNNIFNNTYEITYDDEHIYL